MLKLEKFPLSLLQNILTVNITKKYTVKQSNFLKAISVSKSSMSVSSNSIAQFLTFALKIGNRKVYTIGICDGGDW